MDGAGEQCLLVTTPAAEATTGQMEFLERPHAAALWAPVGLPVSVSVGRRGQTVAKREGDGCSPSGIFRVSQAFGQGPPPAGVRLPWIALTAAHAGVDDPASRYYNQVVDSRHVTRDWSSAENMVPVSGVYRMGAIIDYNPEGTPGRGSCIFLHIHTALGAPTSGCVAMRAADMLRTLRWLDPGKNPVIRIRSADG